MVNHRAVGVDTELKVVTYLRSRGWAGAERYVRTGYQVAGRTFQDPGDILGTMGIAWQCKSLRDNKSGDITKLAEKSLPKWMAETEAQRRATNSDFGVLVVRRWGITNAAHWWAFIPANNLAALFLDQDPNGFDEGMTFPVRMELSHLCDLLIENGYGGK